MSQYIIGQDKHHEEKMIYDCYAISNHYGSMGFGHYTAYCKNPLDEKWYEFDDSRVSEINPARVKDTVVQNSAYNLFFRRRDWHEKNMKDGIDYEKLAIKPDLSYIEKK